MYESNRLYAPMYASIDMYIYVCIDVTHPEHAEFVAGRNQFAVRTELGLEHRARVPLVGRQRLATANVPHLAESGVMCAQ
jgi:hypothetical protein